VRFLLFFAAFCFVKYKLTYSYFILIFVGNNFYGGYACVCSNCIYKTCRRSYLEIHAYRRVLSESKSRSFRDSVLRDNLKYLEVSASHVDDEEQDSEVRYILCHNPIKAKADETFRVTALEEAEKALAKWQDRLENPHRVRKASTQSVMLKIGEILTHKQVQVFSMWTLTARRSRIRETKTRC